MGRKQGQATAFSLVIKPEEVRVRKAFAPAGKPMDDKRRKAPRRRPDLRLDGQDADG
jgi:hypothetical protein